MNLKELLLSLFAGVIVGLVFTLLKFPLPAPPTIGGVMGVVGVYLGSILMQKVDKKDTGNRSEGVA